MKFSIVIAVAPDRKAEVVESLKNIDYPKKDFEIIIEKGLNPSDNRNRGFKKAKGEIIGFIDDDAFISPDLLKNADDFLKQNPDIAIVGGVQLTPQEQRGFGKISGYALSSKFGAWKMANRYCEGKIICDTDETCVTSAILFCRRKVMENINFDPKLFPGEDPRFIYDAKKQGFKVAYNPNLIIYHKRRAGPKGLSKQIFNYGKVRPKKESFFETLKMPFFIIPSLFFIYILTLIFYVLLKVSITGAIIGANEKITLFSHVLFGPLILYIILAILFALYDSTKNKDFKAFFVLPFIYPMIHLSYGAGMIYGHFKKVF
ncbi:MAG: glycosyltransferase [Nanoarchaeota archaeon]|nr:glycosyltransferase [Nanoarchaeota archaeon]